MKSRLGLALAVSTIVASGGILGATAYAQQQTTPSSQQQTPAKPGGAAPAQQTPPPAKAEGMKGPPREFRGRALASLSRMSPQDRAAFLDARLAALKAGLELNADQEKLWAPLEQTIRDGVTKAIQMHQKFAGSRPHNPMQRLMRYSKIASARANFLRSFVDAAQPLYAKLTPEQKHRLPMLMHVMGGPMAMGGQMGAMGAHGGQGREMMGRRMHEMMRRCMREGMMGGRMHHEMGWRTRGEGHANMQEGWRAREHGRRDWRGDEQRGQDNSDSGWRSNDR